METLEKNLNAAEGLKIALNQKPVFLMYPQKVQTNKDLLLDMPKRIERNVSRIFGITLSDLNARTRINERVYPVMDAKHAHRFLTYLHYREAEGKGITWVARRIFKIEHCTLIWTLRKVAELYDYDNDFRAKLDSLIDVLGMRLSFNKYKEVTR